jgi:hypothetical protein
MIAVLKKNGNYNPVILCDHCGKIIDDAMGANQLSSSAPEGATAQAFHVHKGECDRAMCARLGDLTGSEELSVHLIELIRNTFGQSDLERVRNLLQSSTE